MAPLFSGESTWRPSKASHEDDRRPRRQWFPVRRGEPVETGKPEGAGQWLSMAPNDTYRATDVRDFLVRCGEGTLWVTSPEVPGDTLVAAGEQLSVTSRGTLLIVALVPSSMWIPQGDAAREAQGISKLGLGLRTLQDLTPRRLLERAVLQVLAAFSACRPSRVSQARENYLAQSVDHSDFEHRHQTWDVHQHPERLQPPVL